MASEEISVEGVHVSDMQGAAAEAEARWYFYEERPGTWRWDMVDAAGEVVRRSHAQFESRAACVLDAKAHGYGDRAAA